MKFRIKWMVFDHSTPPTAVGYLAHKATISSSGGSPQIQSHITDVDNRPSYGKAI